MLVDKTKVTRLEHPTEDGAWVDIRSLTGAELDQASDVETRRVLKQFEDNLEALMKVSDQRERKETAARKSSYDPDLLLSAAIVAWSEPVPVTPESIALLDAATRDWLWEEVVNRNTRPPKNVSG